MGNEDLRPVFHAQGLGPSPKSEARMNRLENIWATCCGCWPIMMALGAGVAYTAKLILENPQFVQRAVEAAKSSFFGY